LDERHQVRLVIDQQNGGVIDGKPIAAGERLSGAHGMSL
jgi:hypothetical protein